jgi:oxygen-dependent protoporphyrinogen oxidase
MKPVIVIGGGITGLAAAWELQQQGVPYLLLEAGPRLGGKIMTDRRDGFIIEGAADSFLTTKPWAWQLCQELGLAGRLVGTNDKQRNVFVLRGGELHLMPRGMRLLVPVDPAGLLESTLFSEEGKQRMLAESTIPPRPTNGDESLASFVRRRFGEEALEVLGEPLLAGIYTGDPETLSMAATFPQYLDLERTHGNLTTPLRRTESAPPPLAPGQPRSAFVSLQTGVYELIEVLGAKLAGNIRLNSPVERLEPDKTVYLASGEKIEAAGVIVTTPSTPAARLLPAVSAPLAQTLAELKTVSSATVSFGYREEDLPGPLDGFGFVVAAREPTHLLASTWSSTKLPGRAPAGHALLRVFFGGHRHQSDVELPDDQLMALAKAELRQVMHIQAEPVISRIFRWRDANPQYEVGHREKLENLSRRYIPAWLHLAGSSYDGVGIPACVLQGREAAQQIARQL